VVDDALVLDSWRSGHGEGYRRNELCNVDTRPRILVLRFHQVDASLALTDRGATLDRRINGVTFPTPADRDAEQSRKKGFIALPDHGKGCCVAFRNVRIR